jgi:predicted glycoside hydrolase/deacetylase ChbG (UPF0249 family)
VRRRLHHRFLREDLSPGRFLELVGQAFAGFSDTAVAELMCHPGYDDAELSAITSYSAAREREIAVHDLGRGPPGARGMGIAVAGMEAVAAE